MIKNIEDLKNIQIVCRKQEQVKNCLNYLEQLGFDVEDFTEYCDCCNIIFWGYSSKKFIISNMLNRNLSIDFYNKELVKTLQKLIKEKEKEKEKEKLPDFEVAEDGRIIKINNWDSKQIIYSAYDIGVRPRLLGFPDEKINLGLVYATEETADKAKFKLEIETKLKNIAARLNAGRKIDWEDENQSKFIILYDYRSKILGLLDLYGVYRWKYQGGIYCLDKNFLEVAKQEIWEDNLIKYFTE